MTRWDFQNKGKSGWTGTSSFVLEVPLRNLRPSVSYSVPCDRIVQGAYSLHSLCVSLGLQSVTPCVLPYNAFLYANFVLFLRIADVFSPTSPIYRWFSFVSRTSAFPPTFFVRSYCIHLLFLHSPVRSITPNTSAIFPVIRCGSFPFSRHFHPLPLPPPPSFTK